MFVLILPRARSNVGAELAQSRDVQAQTSGCAARRTAYIGRPGRVDAARVCAARSTLESRPISSPASVVARDAVTSRRPQRNEPLADATPFRSAGYLRMRERAFRYARATNAPLLIEGESGTGKTYFARELHLASKRAAGPFEYVVLSALDDSLASSELFGHVEGAFTDARRTRAGHFATARGGTLFLDEIGKASRAVQQKLLHVVERREIRPIGADRDVRVDVRIIAASNVPLEQLVQEGGFLPDLYARLSAFRVTMPALRERRADIPVFAEQFLRGYARELECGAPPAIHADLMRALQRAPWPNNVRQLDAAILRLLVDADGAEELRLEHCVDDLKYLRVSGASGKAGPLSLEAAEEAIARAGGSVSEAARQLGVDRTTVHRARRQKHPGDAVQR
jgi:two-component system, NtrC family, response regulator HydG